MSRRQSLLVWVLIVLGLVVITVMLYRTDYSQMGWWVKPLFVAWITLFMGLFRLAQIKNIGKNLKQQPSAQGNHTWSLSDEGIRLVGPLSTGDIKWEAFVEVRETESDFIFYTSKSISLFLPKRVLADEPQLKQLRHLIGEQLGDKARLISHGVV